MHHSEHTVDVARWLTGAEFSEVYAELGFQRGLPVDDVNVVSARLSDGTAFTTDTSWTTPDSDDFWGESELDVVGTERTLAVDQHGESFRLVQEPAEDRDAGGISRHHFGTSPGEALVRDFVDAVETGRAPLATGLDALRQVEVIEAVYESAETGDPVSLDTQAPE